VPLSPRQCRFGQDRLRACSALLCVVAWTERTPPHQQRSSPHSSGPAREVAQLGQDRVQLGGEIKSPPLLCGVGNVKPEGIVRVYVVWGVQEQLFTLYTVDRDK